MDRTCVAVGIKSFIGLTVFLLAAEVTAVPQCDVPNPPSCCSTRECEFPDDPKPPKPPDGSKPGLPNRDGRVSFEPDTDRMGTDYSAFVADLAECRRRCEEERRCQAFTHQKAAPWCWLKESRQTPTSDTRYNSGVKGGVPDLSIVTVNFAGHATINGVNWQTRVDRLVDAIASLGPDRTPDIISLTETEGWRRCVLFTGPRAGDYEMIDRLIIRLSTQTSRTYRIAYMVGKHGAYGLFSQCPYFSGDVVLYNSSRLWNRNVEDAQRYQGEQTAYDSLKQGFQLRFSLPFCHPDSARPFLESLIDGDGHSANCDRPVPSGPGWTWIYAAPEITSPITAVRFSFRHDPRSTFDFYTLHPMSEREEMSKTFAIQPFIEKINATSFRLDPRFYPPIMVGDLNSLKGPSDSIAGFSEIYGPTGDVMSVRRGNNRFPAIHDFQVLESQIMPKDQANFFSDHNGLYVRLGWLDPLK